MIRALLINNTSQAVSIRRFERTVNIFARKVENMRKSKNTAERHAYNNVLYLIVLKLSRTNNGRILYGVMILVGKFRITFN